MISHKHKFIFTHINKCAGSAVIHSLNTSCSDLVRQGNGHETVLRNMEDCLGEPQEYFKFAFVRNPWDRVLSNYFYSIKIQWKAANWDFSEVKNLEFKDFVRKIYDKTFDWNKTWRLFKSRRRESIHESTIPLRWTSAYLWLVDSNNNVLTDYIGRFENLQEDFDIICEKIGIPKKQLDWVNKSKHKHYSEYYDDETREIVAKNHKEDIKYFGYKFGE